MKKKIKDVTFFDVNEICLKADNCDVCPLYIADKYSVQLCLISQLERSYRDKWSEIIEQEVEI